MDKKGTDRKHLKTPLYVSAYEKLYQFIMDGTYLPGDKLPSEHQLATMLGVSRGTLRQALLLFQEDGLIINKQGSGNYLSEKKSVVTDGLERKQNICEKFSKSNGIWELKNISYQPITQIISDLLQVEGDRLIALFELVYYVKNSPIGCMDIFIPYDILQQLDLPLKDKGKMQEFILKYLEDMTTESRIQLRLVKARRRIADRLGIEESEPLLCFYEVMHTNGGKPLLYSKTYCVPADYDFYIHSHK
ncbi:TPA: GntR family transcriptional regulator [Streptococcus suis]